MSRLEDAPPHLFGAVSMQRPHSEMFISAPLIFFLNLMSDFDLHGRGRIHKDRMQQMFIPHPIFFF
jgi:hypothetical protein